MRAPISSYIEHTVLLGGKFDKNSRDFLVKFFPRSGVGSEASMPVSMHQIPLDGSMKNTVLEIETVLFTAVEDLLVKHNISPKSIDILVSNCSVSCPTPSITAMIINKFKFRSNIMSYSLAGMGCSAGLLSISLAKDILKVHKNSLALVVTMEAITPHVYIGRNKSMLLTNTLFRMGGAAILLSNRKQDKTTAKYELQHLVRTNIGFDDQSYRGIVHEEDEDGTVGINLSPKLLHVAGKGLRTNSTTLGPLVLPYSELIKYGWSIFCQKLCAPLWRKEVYIPDLKMAFDHFCIHAGGKRVIDAVAESLSLCEEDVEPSRMTLYRFGNTSSSSIWYELCYLEAKGKMKKGDKVWQIAFGSGFKCNSGVWKCLSDVDPNVKNAWSDRIHRYPVDIPDQVDH
ncbi:3-ketoacyl-CoA synthase [Thalictrum thalictroides]|uniref:very-long-chain 3-oxoacyl-CoA synthase n=1 Tax=Thalictrum thalictroides TaxID=46969 RepID=A0A7J6V7I7_THATH|nr:3-ketoacyl-CoA synthase [Thalictrum thalictroides]